MKRAVIMGATSGMGWEVARILAEKGWRLGIAARREENLQSLKALYPQSIEYQVIDIEQENAPEHMLSLVKKIGGMDLYFHGSGVGWHNEELDPAVELKTCAVNTVGFTRMVTAAWNYFKEKGGGHIAVISSIAGTKGLGPAPAYSATKSFDNTYIQALAQLSRSSKLGIRFTDIRPGFVDTPLLDTTKHHYPMLMEPEKVSRKIVRAIERKKRVAIIDWRYRILVFFWRLIPNFIWERIKL
ncbi:MAG: SDR family NAD(P)-dependent oxidoreductase [Bacteroidales bacterium]|nr:SDR family NAD(P)-dependent oxidoreductase [Bacteroidales bacterium]